MNTKTLDKIMESLANLLEGLSELEEDVKANHDLDPEAEELEDPEEASEIEAEIVTEARAAIETLMDNDDYSSEEIANVLTIFTEALQEIDPDIFDTSSSTDDDFEDDDEEDDDMDDLESFDDLDEDDDYDDEDEY